MSIQERIRNRRNELSMSAETLAEKIGVAKSTVLRYESKGIEKLPIDLVRPLAKALDVSPSYLLGWDAVYSDSQDEEIVSAYKNVPASIELPDNIEGLRLMVQHQYKQNSKPPDSIEKSGGSLYHKYAF